MAGFHVGTALKHFWRISKQKLMIGHMIGLKYLTAIGREGNFRKYPHLIIDEGQDCPPEFYLRYDITISIILRSLLSQMKIQRP